MSHDDDLIAWGLTLESRVRAKREAHRAYWRRFQRAALNVGGWVAQGLAVAALWVTSYHLSHWLPSWAHYLVVGIGLLWLGQSMRDKAKR